MARDLSRETAERLLSGASASPTPDGDPLAALLTAAAAPASPHELAGEPEALAAFRALPPPKHRLSLRRALAVKIAAVVAATVAAGGIAVASSGGMLPNPFKPPATTSASPRPSAAGSVAASSAAGASPTPSPKQLPAMALPGLCHAFQAKPAKDRGKALDSPAFSALVAAAGKPQNVESFCARILATPRPKQTGQPAKSPKSPNSHRTTSG